MPSSKNILKPEYVKQCAEHTVKVIQEYLDQRQLMLDLLREANPTDWIDSKDYVAARQWEVKRSIILADLL